MFALKLLGESSGKGRLIARVSEQFRTRHIRGGRRRVRKSVVPRTWREVARRRTRGHVTKLGDLSSRNSGSSFSRYGLNDGTNPFSSPVPRKAVNPRGWRLTSEFVIRKRHGPALILSLSVSVSVCLSVCLSLSLSFSLSLSLSIYLSLSLSVWNYPWKTKKYLKGTSKTELRYLLSNFFIRSVSMKPEFAYRWP